MLKLRYFSNPPTMHSLDSLLAFWQSLDFRVTERNIRGESFFFFFFFFLLLNFLDIIVYIRLLFFFCLGLSDRLESGDGEVDEDNHDRIASPSPPLHHLPPPPPPPPPNDLRGHFPSQFSIHAHLHGQTSLNRSSSPAHDLGYHTLVARSPAPWSPNDLADLSLTPSPR